MTTTKKLGGSKMWVIEYAISNRTLTEYFDSDFGANSFIEQCKINNWKIIAIDTIGAIKN
jgi:hypothetical protein